MHRYTILRVALIVAAILIWRWVARTHPSMTDPRQWAARAGGALVWTGAVILAFYIVASAILTVRARHHGGPDAAMGIGCATMITFVLLGAAALLAVGIIFHIAWLVTIISIGSLLSFIPIGGGLIVEGYKALIKRRQNGRVVPAPYMRPDK